jgi:hypothetical protein
MNIKGAMIIKKIALLMMIIALIICPEIISINYGVLSKNIFVETPIFFIQKMVKYNYNQDTRYNNRTINIQ